MSQDSGSQKRMPATFAGSAPEIEAAENARFHPYALRTTDNSPTDSALSEREQEVIARVAQGKNNVEIAALLTISPFTVKNHMQRIIRKLGVSNRTEAAVRYLNGDPRRMRRRSTDREVLQSSDSTETPA